MFRELQLKTPRWSFIFAFLAATAMAQEETSVLPKGIFRTWVIGAFGGTNYQFNASGRRQGLAHMLNRSVTMIGLQNALAEKPVNANKARDIGRLRTELNSFGLNVGNPELGDSLYQADIYADAQVEASQLVYALEYGFTTRLSMGLAVPLQWYNIKARVRIENQNSFGSALQTVKNTPLESEIERFAVEVQDSNAFKNTLFTGNGYQIPGNTKIFGMGDMEGGIKYRAYESEYVDSAFLVGFRLPTASHQKDVHNLLDQPTGDRQFDLALQGALDFKIRPNLIFLTAAKYTLQTPDTESVVGPIIGSTSPLPDLNDPRVRDSKAQRNLGDMVDVNFNLRYSMFQKKFTLVGAYIYQFKNQDHFSGNNPHLDYAALAKNTERQSHAAEFFMIYSTVADFFRKEKAIPWEASITYHHTLAGVNTPDLRYAYARVKFFFN